jgi:hypothetical protein
MPGLIPLPILGEPAPLCRAGDHTCAACCHGEAVARLRLEHLLERNTALFGSLFKDGAGGWWRWRLHEVLARGPGGLAWALLLLLPGLPVLLRPWLRRRSVCAFLGYEDPERSRVGCLLHPTRQGGRDVRRRAAFALWHGFGCGEPGYLCLPAHRFRRAGWRLRKQFLDQAETLDWYAYSQRVQGSEAHNPSPP